MMSTKRAITIYHNKLVALYNEIGRSLPDGEVRGNHATIVALEKAYARRCTLGEVIDSLKDIIDTTE